METDSGPVLESMNGIRSRRALAVCAVAVMAACAAAPLSAAQGPQERDSEAWRAARKMRVSEDVEVIARSPIRRDPEVVRAFLDAGFHPDEARDDSGRTLLALAAMDGDFDIFEILLAAGADPESKANDGRVVLHFAAEGGSLDVVEALIEAGVELDVRDDKRRSPRYYAAINAHPHILRAFAEAGFGQSLLEQIIIMYRKALVPLAPTPSF